jgi:hypothetical protein
MKKLKRPKLKVESALGRHFITVPLDHAKDLRSHLQSCGIISGWPEPCYKGFESIELARDSDTAAIQKVLREWQ